MFGNKAVPVRSLFQVVLASDVGVGCSGLHGGGSKQSHSCHHVIDTGRFKIFAPSTCSSTFQLEDTIGITFSNQPISQNIAHGDPVQTISIVSTEVVHRAMQHS